MTSLTEISDDRFCLMPMKHPEVYKNYEDQLSKFWTFTEINHNDDYKSWLTMNTMEQLYIAKVLAFFANSDNAVMENIGHRFLKEITWPEAQMALAQQRAMESIHVVSYNNMIDSVIKDPTEKMMLFQAVKHDPIIRKKIEWTIKWAGNPDVPLHVCVVAQACAEGIGFASSFAAMLWLRTQNLCPGIAFGNQKIIVDESLHVKLFGILYRTNDKKMPRQEILDMVKELVTIEYEFIDASLPTSIKNMNAVLLKQYVQKTADVVLEELGEKPFYNATNPFPWMETASMKSQTNFFEKSVPEYSIASTTGDLKNIQLDNDLDF